MCTTLDVPGAWVVARLGHPFSLQGLGYVCPVREGGHRKSAGLSEQYPPSMNDAQEDGSGEEKDSRDGPLDLLSWRKIRFVAPVAGSGPGMVWRVTRGLPWRGG